MIHVNPSASPVCPCVVKRTRLGVLLTRHFLVNAVNPVRVIFNKPSRLPFRTNSAYDMCKHVAQLAQIEFQRK